MTTLAFDASNYTSDFSEAAVEAMKNEWFDLAIIQAIDPPPGYPPGKTAGQVAFCAANGLTVDAYLWLWMDLDVSDITRKLALLEGLPIRQLWLDVEDTAAIKYDQATCEQKVAEALAACDLWAEANGLALPRAGVYSGRWYWADPRYMGDTVTFSDRKLWDSDYDGVPDAGFGFAPYGGWTKRAIKQYRGTTVLHGVSGVDLNVLSDEEAMSLYAEPEPESSEPTAAEFRQALSYLRHDVMDPLRSYKYPRIKTTVAEVERVAEQYKAK